VDPRNLQLEVLETSAIDAFAIVSRLIRQCQAMGVSFALDDFGTGYSSLTYLKQVPAELLKIDQGFVRGMLDDPEDLAIVEGVLGLATAFRRDVIAEGVETLAHGEVLLRLGCHLGQGYAIAPPMPADELPAWLSNWQVPAAWRDVEPVSHQRLPLLMAAARHREWRHRMLDYLSGDADEPAEIDAQQCRAGRWLNRKVLDAVLSVGAAHDLDLLHARVHELAGQLVELKQQGDGEALTQRLATFVDLSDQLISRLGALR
jgi:hypothetical protein